MVAESRNSPCSSTTASLHPDRNPGSVDDPQTGSATAPDLDLGPALQRCRKFCTAASIGSDHMGSAGTDSQRHYPGVHDDDPASGVDGNP